MIEKLKYDKEGYITQSFCDLEEVWLYQPDTKQGSGNIANLVKLRKFDKGLYFNDKFMIDDRDYLSKKREG